MWTFGKKVAAGFGATFVLLAAIGIVAYRSIERLTDTSYLVAHSHNVLEHVAGVLGLLKDAETGQRGFVITGDEAFLEPYTEALVAIPKAVKDLRDLTTDNASQQRHLDEVESVIASKLVELDKSIELRRKGGFEPAQKMIASGRGKRFMDDLRRSLTQLEQEERQLLKQRANDVEA